MLMSALKKRASNSLLDAPGIFCAPGFLRNGEKLNYHS
ncbi:hypothetical protein M23134_07164 [Microscilla marina ATCC 23134]|uniref:Uncharacterized protein n=1 Tax=Microscilla marina ATCC 23134 TaxID=313606 RepID=A1ZUJ6_MICM2|nr:hypothetical protein M23134_07164 [Microscilla marina ATCC 23134]